MQRLSSFVVAFVLFVLFVIPTQAFAPTKPSPYELPFDLIADYALVLDQAYDALPSTSKQMFTTDAEMEQWAREILPFFSYEGIGLLPIYPSSIEFEDYIGRNHSHLLGQFNCFSGELTLNARFGNPQSAWYGDVMALGTLVHELAHGQGICVGHWYDEEVSAQLAMLEVLASMANQGSEHALAALLFELRDMALASARYAALHSGEPALFDALAVEVYDAFELARVRKSDRVWSTDPQRLEEILSSYNAVPFRILVAALKTDLKVEGVFLPINADCHFPPSNYMGYETEEHDCVIKPLLVDDLAYVTTHTDEMVADAQAMH